VSYNKNEYEEYKLDNLFIKVDKFNYNNEIKLHNYNCDIRLSLNILLNDNNNNNNFITDIKKKYLDKCVNLNILNDKFIYDNINNVYEKYLNNIFFNKTDYYWSSVLLNNINDFKDISFPNIINNDYKNYLYNNHNLFNDIENYLLVLKNNNKLTINLDIDNNNIIIIVNGKENKFNLIKYEDIYELNEYKIKKNINDIYYLMSIVGDNKKKIIKEDVIFFPENKINTIQEPKYLIFLRDIKNFDNIQISFNQYTNKNLSSRYNFYKF
jgi:hypothetical protein